MPLEVCGVQYTFHGVGQGLFASGALGTYRHGYWMGEEIDDVKFRWVYDCGTASGNAIMDATIRRFVENSGYTDRKLGLVALSHFDRDHISGVVRLLREFEVDVLLLPYIPLGERLLLAHAERLGAQDPLLLFFINPVAYLRGADIRRIRRVVFVEGRASDSRENGGGFPLPDQRKPREWPEGEFRLEFDGRPISEVEPELEDARVGDTFLLDSGSALRIASLWEFVPHNDIGQGGTPTDMFRRDVGEIAEKLRRAADDVAREEALRDLKARYDQEFGRDAAPRNRISLFLYAGPTDQRAFDEGRMNSWAICMVDDGVDHLRHLEVSKPPRGEVRGSILYTGDGYLDTDARITALKLCLEDQRLKAIAVCQIMHHGAKGNWRPGVAAMIAPYFSVFSSDPNTKNPGHPHAEVLRDFWCHGPVQVDKRASAQFHFWWEKQMAPSP